MIKCLILDFDNTIADTSSLLEYRKNKDWSSAINGLKNCPLHQLTINLINFAQENNILIAIFSNSPKVYLENALLNFNIHCDFIVAYHDVTLHKPSPEGITKILKYFSLEENNVIFIGDDELDYKTAVNANIDFVGVPWGKFNSPHLIKFLENDSTNNFFELLILKELNVKLIQNEDNHFYLGYYLDEIKYKLLDFKSRKTIVINEWISIVCENMELLPKFNFVVRALGHEEMEIIETNTPLDELALAMTQFTKTIYLPNLLKKHSKTKKSTTLTQIERYNEIHHKYYLDNDVSTKYLTKDSSILIIDDVFTSGATTNEIIRAIHHDYPHVKCYIFSLVKTSYADSSLSFKQIHNIKLLKTFQMLKAKKNTNKFFNKFFTANYTNSNHNFIVQNLYDNRFYTSTTHMKYISGVFILKNILQRGKPTLMSKFLQMNLGSLQKDTFFSNSIAFIETGTPKWKNIIRGDDNAQYYPAKKFFEIIIPKYLKELSFIQSLLLPEATIYEITQAQSKEFAKQQVDFYLQQAMLVIEIDGSQHGDNNLDDINRDNYLRKFGIEVFRIKTNDLESENEFFFNTINQIKNRINDFIEFQEKRKKSEPQLFISLKDYQAAYASNDDYNNAFFKATSIIRIQLVLLELLENGILSFESDWRLEVKLHDVEEFIELAIEDLFIWFQHIYKLQKVPFLRPHYSIQYIHKNKKHSSGNNTIKIDFSLMKRYTDEFQYNQNIIFVRNHYLDEYQYINLDNATNIDLFKFKPYDYFRISTATPIDYKFQLGDEGSDYFSLLFFLENIFLQEIPNLDFNEGQLAIITNALSGNDTIGLLPTGSGKSICYQLSALLQPAVSFVVCPIKSLMYDQKADLDSILFHRSNYITSDMESFEKEQVANQFSNGKYLFIFISPERFQTKAFRLELSKINKDLHFAYAVIDEVHCLSEWGHDFRTSYLNLSNTIKRYSPDSRYIGLTATASLNVLKDIQNEFNISQMDVKTPLSYTRKELVFNVIDDQQKKQNAIEKILKDLNEKSSIFTSNGNESKCGIIFTPTVNGKKGCFKVSLYLTQKFQTEIPYYSGSVPTINKTPIMPEKEFDKFKRDVQDRFKKNEFTLLVATKAFGMGVNKGNIHYTIHYGLPASMESLYQEAGRAGRDKQKFLTKKAQCIVLFTKEKDENKTILDQLWNAKTNLNQISILQKKTTGDLNTNFFMFINSLDTINNEFKLIRNLFSTYCVNNNTKIESKKLQSNKAKVEKAIYRLNQLGIIKDWTIDNFFSGIFDIEIAEDLSENTIKDNLLNVIHKYEEDFSLEKFQKDTQSNYYYVLYQNPDLFSEIEKSILVLLIWSYNHFAYNRRQSLKNVYENCLELSSGKISKDKKDKFKQTLENYFTFNETSFLLQHIADYPFDYTKWFDVFYSNENVLVNNSKLIELKDQLSRFLESYMNHPGLDFISGLTRLLLNDFDNSDGSLRMSSSIQKIKEDAKFDPDFIITNLLTIVQTLNIETKREMAQFLLGHFHDGEFKYKIYKSLEDDYSASIIINSYITRLKKIYKTMEKICQI